MTDNHDFPTDFAAGPAGEAGALRWTSAVLALTALALAVLNAGAIAGWAEDLPASPGTARVMAAADAWQTETAQLGLDAAHAGLHSGWKRAQAMPWPADGEPAHGTVSGGREPVRVVVADELDR